MVVLIPGRKRTVVAAVFSRVNITIARPNTKISTKLIWGMVLTRAGRTRRRLNRSAGVQLSFGAERNGK